MPSRHQQKTSSSYSREPRRSTGSVSASHPKTEILVNVYDLLPPGRLASTLWHLGSSLLHTGLVIRSLDREYAYGGHDRPHLSGVYWTVPQAAPPGATWRCELLQGFSRLPVPEIERVVEETSRRFQGTDYNLLSQNCNHFTSDLCEKLTGRPAPKWVNRAASIGIALPCMVPREWVTPPDFETAEGDLVGEEGDEEDDDDGDESTGMLTADGHSPVMETHNEGATARKDRGRTGDVQGKGQGKAKGKGEQHAASWDTEGRILPVPERAPVPPTTYRAGDT